MAFDSRRVRPGFLYVGLPGTSKHGAAFAGKAATAGAAALLTDVAGARLIESEGLATPPVAMVEDARYAMAIASCRSYGQPAQAMTSLGVTGTNGKSTTVLMLAAALDGAGRRVGSIGTLGFLVGGEPLELDRTTITTPESPDLQATLAMMLDRGADTVAMEVSSHALSLQRVAGIRFDVVGFTNLGRDHLEFHHTIEEYFAAKARLFTPDHADRAVINGDAEAGRRLLQQAADLGLPAVSVGFSAGCIPGHPVATVRFGQQLHIGAPERHDRGGHLPAGGLQRRQRRDRAGDDRPGRTRHVGRPARPGPGGHPRPHAAGRPAHRERLGRTSGLRRLRAHSQAISSALDALNHPALASARVLVVLGAGGDRDPDKREPMGRAAAQGADVVVVTDDNPRSEDPAIIRSRVLAGARSAIDAAEPGSRLAAVELLDGGERRAAIGQALRLARPGDAIAVLGKGHERTQQLDDETIEFDDVEVVREQWARIIAEGKS